MSENTFSRSRLETFSPYKPSNQEAWFLAPDAQPLKLDWNESPLPPSPKVFSALEGFLKHPNALNWYPDANSRKLRDRLGAFWKIDPECVQTYCGSDSALHSAVHIFTKANDLVLMVSPTYDNFRIYALEAECRVALDGPEDIYVLTRGDLEALIRKHQPRLVYVANPNNPTGWLLSTEDIAAISAQFPDVMLIVDEAYAEYSGVTSIPLAIQRPNIVVHRTFSKAYGLAGLRIGYVVTSTGNTEQFNLIRNGKNVSMVAQVAAIAALEDGDYLAAVLDRVKKGQAVLEAGLRRLGIVFRSTPANFVLTHFEDAVKVQKELAAQHIYVRPMSHLPKLNGYLRITLGDAEQMNRFLSALESILSRS
jgi:histidinol-phosphate aminotransferase